MQNCTAPQTQLTPDNREITWAGIQRNSGKGDVYYTGFVYVQLIKLNRQILSIIHAASSQML